jgi:undecaprenyl diphosphate synthase
MSLEQLLASIPPGSSDEALARQVNFELLPAHVAIIMDGNGRWARSRGLPRPAGHRASVKVVRRTVEECARRAVRYLTLFAFSSENWRRPPDEVGMLMNLFLDALEREVADLHRNGVRLRFLGICWARRWRNAWPTPRR